MAEKNQEAKKFEVRNIAGEGMLENHFSAEIPGIGVPGIRVIIEQEDDDDPD